MNYFNPNFGVEARQMQFSLKSIFGCFWSPTICDTMQQNFFGSSGSLVDLRPGYELWEKGAGWLDTALGKQVSLLTGFPLCHPLGRLHWKD